MDVTVKLTVNGQEKTDHHGFAAVAAGRAAGGSGSDRCQVRLWRGAVRCVLRVDGRPSACCPASRP